jgi:preprotein translocase subunit SecE
VEKLVTKSTTAKAVSQNRIVNYLRETWFELRKVSWPTRSEAINLTLIVVSVTTFLAIVLGLMDWLFATGFGLFI